MLASAPLHAIIALSHHTPELFSILGFSILLLSADLHNPRVRTKMTKREFVRNTRDLAGRAVSPEFLGWRRFWLYVISFSSLSTLRNTGIVFDYVFLHGHIASPAQACPGLRAEVLAESPRSFARVMLF